MDTGPRPSDEAILGPGRLATVLFGAAVMAAGTLGMYLVAESRWGEPVALSMTFTTFVLFQAANVLNARSSHTTVFSRYSFTNGKLWVAIAAVIVLQVLAVRWGPMLSLFATEPLDATQILLCFVVGLVIIPAEELRKLVAKLVRRS